jgi:anti-sigma regulatory factor (Ser/Thr protein kinase)
MESAFIISATASGVQNVVGESLTIEVPNSRDAIARAGEEAERWLELYQPAPQVLNLVLLAIEELVTNCIEYGYNDADEHTIVIVLSISDGNLTMDAIDDGHPFNPLTQPTPDFSLQVQDRPIGGLGIYLLRKLADHISYERRDGTNRLTLTKRLR